MLVLPPFFMDLSMGAVVQFHMPRSKAIFDWIFGLGGRHYELYYLQSPNVGLSEEAVEARREREARSLASVEKFAESMKTMRDVWSFLNERHDLYTASKLADRARNAGEDASDLVKKSYGAN